MSNGFRRVSKLALCASLTLLTVAAAPLLAKDRSESGGPAINGQPHHLPIHHLKKVTAPGLPNQIFRKADCIADCGDGTGWECSGPDVYCEDGVGCAASNGDITLIGLCGDD